MIEPHSITDADKLACVERELTLRRNLYPSFVKKRQMSTGKAALEIAIMEQIVADYRAAVEKQKAESPVPDEVTAALMVPAGMEDF